MRQKEKSRKQRRKTAADEAVKVVAADEMADEAVKYTAEEAAAAGRTGVVTQDASDTAEEAVYAATE